MSRRRRTPPSAVRPPPLLGPLCTEVLYRTVRVPRRGDMDVLSRSCSMPVSTVGPCLRPVLSEGRGRRGSGGMATRGLQHNTRRFSHSTHLQPAACSLQPTHYPPYSLRNLQPEVFCGRNLVVLSDRPRSWMIGLERTGTNDRTGITNDKALYLDLQERSNLFVTTIGDCIVVPVCCSHFVRAKM